MRYALVSDLHANIQAWNAVFQDILNIGVDQIVSLGDIVGYGPDPMRVIESCYANVHHFVMGNHDAAACGKMPLKRFSTDSRQIINWTSRQLDDAAIDFLSEQPFV
ncbi:MAG: metallophosphatase family protein, partial [Lentisphaerae bacterium]